MERDTRVSWKVAFLVEVCEWKRIVNNVTLFNSESVDGHWLDWRLAVT